MFSSLVMHMRSCFLRHNLIGIGRSDFSGCSYVVPRSVKASKLQQSCKRSPVWSYEVFKGGGHFREVFQWSYGSMEVDGKRHHRQRLHVPSYPGPVSQRAGRASGTRCVQSVVSYTDGCCVRELSWFSFSCSRQRIIKSSQKTVLAITGTTLRH